MDELAVLDGGKCILQLRGVRPFLSDKYDITKHPRWPQAYPGHKGAAFDEPFDFVGYLGRKREVVGM